MAREFISDYEIAERGQLGYYIFSKLYTLKSAPSACWAIISYFPTVCALIGGTFWNKVKINWINRNVSKIFARNISRYFINNKVKDFEICSESDRSKISSHIRDKILAAVEEVLVKDIRQYGSTTTIGYKLGWDFEALIINSNK